jgi:hypothetical protein
MKIEDNFMRVGRKTNKRISIISSGGNPTRIPKSWRPIQGSSDMLVVIPDVHMYMRQSPQDNFRYGAEALSDLLDHLDTLKADFEGKGKVLRIYQLGDFFEMRFGSLANPGTNATPSEIRMSDPDYDLIINKMDYLRTHMLYGNHDFELRHFPSMRFGAVEGKVYLEHGFAPSPWSENPGNLLWEPAQLGFKFVREIESFFLNLAVSFNIISRDDHYALGVTSGEEEKEQYPDERNYPIGQTNYYVTRLLGRVDGPNMRVCIIGHTHQPYLNLRESADGGGWLFVDAGAWTEGRSDFVVLTDEEIAICHYKRAKQFAASRASTRSRGARTT